MQMWSYQVDTSRICNHVADQRRGNRIANGGTSSALGARHCCQALISRPLWFTVSSAAGGRLRSAVDDVPRDPGEHSHPPKQASAHGQRDEVWVWLRLLLSIEGPFDGSTGHRSDAIGAADG